MVDRRYRSPEFLEQEYVESKRSKRGIADMCDVSPSTVSRRLRRHDISQNLVYQDEAWLREHYIENGWAQKAIVRECGVAKTTVCYWLARNGITRGEGFDTAKCRACDDNFRYYPSVREGQYCSGECANSQRKRQVSVVRPNCGETFRRRASLDTEDCSPACWGEDLYADTEAFYQGIWEQQRQKALVRDSFRCTVCSITNERHLELAGQELDVHHEVPVRLFAKGDKPPADAHALRNLRTVCVSHHPDRPGTIG